jgi:hypothetical protein
MCVVWAGVPIETGSVKWVACFLNVKVVINIYNARLQ